MLKRRIADLEWTNERKERKDKKNNIVIKGLNWKTERLEQEVKEFVKDSVRVRIGIKKVSKIKLNGSKNM